MLDKTIGPNEWPFYMQEQEPVTPLKEPAIVRLNANTLSNYQVSPAGNPSPNTLVPVDADGLLPVAILPPVSVVHIPNRAGTKTYNLIVEDDGALSIDEL